MRRAVSVTLKADNLLWLRAQAAANREQQSQRGARPPGHRRPRIRSDGRGGRFDQWGTIDLPDDDPMLERADAFVRAQFDKSLRRPMAAKESRARYTATRKRRG